MAKAKKKSKVENVPIGSNRRITLWGVGCFLLAVVAGLANKWHVETMFENDKHFSHLGTTYRPMYFTLNDPFIQDQSNVIWHFEQKWGYTIRTINHWWTLQPGGKDSTI